MTYPINAAGVALLHERENFIGHAYPDPYSPLGRALQRAGLWRRYLQAPFRIPDDLAKLSGKPWTIGFGFTEGVREGDRMTRAQADSRLARELRPRVDAVLAACKATPNENQLAAMVSLAFNIGTDGFLKSTVLRCHNSGDFGGAARAFRLWNKAGGQVSEGLEARRAAEAALYLRPVPVPVAVRVQPDFAESAPAPIPDFEESLAAAVAAPEPVPIPQQVDGESGARHSPIVLGTSISGGAGVLSLLSETSRTIGDIRYSLGDWLPYVLLALVIGGAGWAIWSRIKQRRGGWA